MMFWYGHDMNGLGYAVMFISMIAFWGVLISLFFWPPARFRSFGGRPTPEQMLAGRFARGEIDHDEYASRQAALNAHARS
jgi:putative membrane protein